MAVVYFKSASTPYAKSALHLSIEKLMEKVDFIEEGDIVAVKVHMGEFGNTGYVRPVFVRKVVDFVKAKGGKPFVTDTTTLYGGRRGNAIDYLLTASINGFSISSMGCPVIIADGLLGRDEEFLSLDGNEIGVAKSIFESDALIVLSHFKGHGMTGFGGAIKNVGMGCCGKNGKIWQHEASKPLYDEKKCILCRKCLTFCPADAISEDDGKIFIEYEKCKGCGACTVLCEQRCFYLTDEIAKEFQKRVAISAKAVLDKFSEKSYFINFLMDITPRCDCCSFADKPIINDVGITASNDAVAVDKASYDLVCNTAGRDVFYEIHHINGLAQVEEAKNLLIGEMEYKLLEI